MLIDAGTELNRRDNRGFTVLHKIDEPALEWLIGVLARHGANLDARNDGDETPFDRAMLDRRPWLARALAAAGANLNARRVNDDDSWLWELTNREDLERVTLLLERGANADAFYHDLSARGMAAAPRRQPERHEPPRRAAAVDRHRGRPPRNQAAAVARRVAERRVSGVERA